MWFCRALFVSRTFLYRVEACDLIRSVRLTSEADRSVYARVKDKVHITTSFLGYYCQPADQYSSRNALSIDSGIVKANSDDPVWFCTRR